jgi:hypothetical protein
MPEPSFFRVGARFQAREPAGTVDVPGVGEVPVQFAQDDFTTQAGRTVPLRVRGDVVGHARVCEATVADDGRSVLFTYEITDLSPGQAGGDDTVEVGS